MRKLTIQGFLLVTMLTGNFGNLVYADDTLVQPDKNNKPAVENESGIKLESN